MTGHRRLVKIISGISEEENAFDLGGLPQGCPMSPILWAIVADFALSFAHEHGGPGYELGNVLPESEKSVFARFKAYADDLGCSDETKMGIEATVIAMVTILIVFNIRLSVQKCIHAWSMAVQEYFMKNRHQLDEIDIIGLEIVPERLGKPEQGQDNTDEVVGHVVGPAGNNKFIIKWLDDSKIPTSHSWSDIGKRV
jgi:hypothetical protein